jgi:hypothetical protein
MTSCPCSSLEARACLVERVPEPMLLDNEVCGCACHGELPAGCEAMGGLSKEDFLKFLEEGAAALDGGP